ncbi:envelope stress response membrane protein PspB [Vibrio viridaestus]|uniref:Envelope stress response membrane protein PspB n=1 Tax=Vibrio viridaestus TaxID=2487322 RepID=A0A3N9U6M7_9VIBR|nr:envelope stress response membrane protein PspB [Vibrio viridaestus]RQW63726.1 envelope stress response membrane protein PspB [Vibrio viridaestus]
MTFSFVFLPLLAFIVFVAPLWLILHYRSKRKADSGLNEQDMGQLHELTRQAESLKQRIRTLEKILDDEAPNWREYNGR